MNQLSEILAQTTGQISLAVLVMDIILTAICALILSKFYVSFGKSLSNRQRLADNFLLISVTTALIITVVKSSLALSLGLVGALSIVRFRSAIKEPEELSYLFLSISLGLGFGANQHLITLVSFALILIFVYSQTKMKGVKEKQNLFLNIVLPEKKNSKRQLKDIVNKLKNHCAKIDLKRIDQSGDQLEASFNIEFKTIEDIDRAMAKIRSLSKMAKISLIDQSGIIV